MAVVIYNGYTLPNQHGKISFGTSESNVTIRYTTNFSVLATDLAAVLDSLKIPDKDFTVFGITYSITGSATRIKTTVEKAGTPADGPRQYLTLTVEITLKDDKVGDNGLRDFSSDLTIDEQRAKIISITGNYTATPGGSGAFANYNSNIGSLVATLQSFYGGGVYFPSRQEIVDHDRFDNELQFQATTVEAIETKNVFDGSNEQFDTGVMFSRWNHTSSRQLERGHNDKPIEFVTVQFECLYDRAFATPRSTLRDRIAGLMIKRLISQFNCSGVVLASADEGFSATQQSANATWTFRCDFGPQYSRFNETISDNLAYGSAQKVTDGKPLTMAPFSAGAVMKLTQSVDAEYIGSNPGDPLPPSVNQINDAVLIPETRDRVRGTTKYGTEDIGVGSMIGAEEERFTLLYSKVWWVVIPSADDPDKTVVRPAQPG